jgi:hypothetical protein
MGSIAEIATRDGLRLIVGIGLLTGAAVFLWSRRMGSDPKPRADHLKPTIEK